ncbi:MAG TPA: hypothetical protein ENK04_15585 [Gammaproteobacteria bacterium]|nr:hypothetical protein [Gammaproteobacteria bacterium]
MAKHKNALLLRQRPRFNHHTFFILLLGIAFTLGGMILDIRSAYALNPGDIAILGVRADDIDGTAGNGNDDAFAWVPLVNLAPGAEIFFTDAGWTAANTFRAQEGAIKYTAPAGGLAAGTVMLLELTRDGSGAYIFTPSGGGGTYSNANDAFVGTTGFLTATSGDQVFIFEGSTAAPVFIWGWKNESPFDADATSNDTSALPPGLTAGVNALAVDNGASTDNNRYVGTSSGTALALAAAIADPANWETNAGSSTSPDNAVWANHAEDVNAFGTTQNTTMAAGAVAVANAPSGGGQAHENRPPQLAMHYIICLEGIYPARS